jgi:hypothetical protein
MRPHARARFAVVLIAVGALCACATGQNHSNHHDASAIGGRACPDVRRWGAPQLYGTWEVELTQAGQRGRLLLRQHPEFRESLRGEFSYGGQASIASGDVEGGEVNLDESRDGKSLHAFWSGHLVPGACGREIRGTWQQLAREGVPAAESGFILRRGPAPGGW